MDARIDPAAAFGIDLGDAHVIRNAGASARDAIRSIVISEQLLGTQEVLLVKHTGTHALSIPASLNKSSHQRVPNYHICSGQPVLTSRLWYVDVQER
jgi:carbonic anhydrase